MLFLLLAASLVSARTETKVGVDSEGPKTMCLGDWKGYGAAEDFVQGMAIRCGQFWELNGYTGKCVPINNNWLDPMTCSQTKCGTLYTCDPKTILCLENDFPRRTIVESAPPLKLCKDIYGNPKGLWFGETADEVALGFNQESDEAETKVGVDSEGPKTMCLGDWKGYGAAEDFVQGMAIRCGQFWELNGYTGKCVPINNNWLDPMTCSQTKCGTLYTCDPKTILCLKNDFPRRTIVESAPPLKLCKDIYGNPKGLWFGETADEVALGFNQESDESYLAMKKPQSNTSMFVYTFAVFGFGVVAYGAVQYYTKA